MLDFTTLSNRLQPYLKFRFLMLGLLVLFFARHGMRIDVHIGKENDAVPLNVSPQAQQHEPSAKAQLASFKHPVTQSKSEVARLRQNYIATYAPIARAEMKAHGIPASITLAQGLLESVAGTSKLATRTNNHFGIKCFKRTCQRGHCHNFEDDHHKDFFRNFEDPAESYRAHSHFLVHGARYKSLFKLSPKDYKGWAKGLRAAGYATDKKYAEKLIRLIERYELDTYDN